MNRPARNDWHNAWELHAPSGSAHHTATGLTILVHPQGLTVGGMVLAGSCWLAAGVVDRRNPGAVAAGDPNRPGVDRWGLWAPAEGPGSLQQAMQALLATMPAHDATQALARLKREAGELWLFRARIDRERPRPQSAAGTGAPGVSAS
jgi:hypothetical protein